MGERFNMAFIGAGSRANQVHYPAFASLGDVRICAVCDIDARRLKDTCDKYGVPEEARYTGGVHEYRRMLDEVRPDGVAVIGQPHIMYDIWLDCLERGLNLYIEKPLGLTLHQARSLALLARRRGCVATVAHQRRASPVVERMREECLKRGPLTHALVRFYKCEQRDRLDARDHMMDDTVHAIDTLLWALNGQVSAIHSNVRRVGTSDINFISATLEFDSGAVGYLINSWSSGRRIFDMEMHAPGICAEVEHEKGGWLYADGDTHGTYYDAAECAGSSDFWTVTGVTRLARDFVDCCRDRSRTPISSFDSALRTMTVAERILARATLDDR